MWITLIVLFVIAVTVLIIYLVKSGGKEFKPKLTYKERIELEHNIDEESKPETKSETEEETGQETESDATSVHAFPPKDYLEELLKFEVVPDSRDDVFKLTFSSAISKAKENDFRNSLAEFSKSLDIIINKALNSTTTQVNLLDEYGKPTETNVNMTFYDNFSGVIKYNFIHTLNNKGLPDTLMIDPLLTYDVVVHTIPPVKADSIKLTSGKHTIIPVNAPQGYLNLKIGSHSNIVKDLQGIIRKVGEAETINVQSFGQKEKYLTGIYDIEVLCLPRIYIDSVTIKQSHTTTIEIPMPGIAVIKKTTYGYGSLYLENNNKLEWIYNFRDNNPYQETLILQPGIYRVVFRSRYSNKSFFTIEKSFSIQSGKSINVKLF